MKRFLLILVAVLAAAGGWFFGRLSHDHPAGPSPSSERKVLYYQSPMHPWVKSEQPGNCTVCGMELVPVYEGGGSAGDGAATDVVMLPQGAPNVMNVRTVEVQRRPLERTLRVAGTIDDDQTRHRILSATTGGRIEKLFVNYEGAEVKEGEPLATFYSKELLDTLREYKAIYGQGPSPMLTRLEMRLRQLGMNDAQIARAPTWPESQVFTEILAPMTGTVVKRYVFEGQYVEEGDMLFELADFTHMWFQFIAYEQDLPFLKVGQIVKITSPALPGRVIEAPISFINPNLDDATRSARVRVEFENPRGEDGLHEDHLLLHRVYAEGVVQLDPPEVVVVPKDAVLWTGKEPRVYVELEPGTYQQRRLILGRQGDELWEVLEGVQPGERVVASGNMLIDSQAQIDRLGAPPETAPIPESMPEMTAAEHEQMEAFFEKIAGLSAALASDDLGDYNTALAQLPPVPKALGEIEKPPPAETLAGARRSFLPLSEAAAQYALEARGHFPELRVFRCPMTNQAGEGMPKNARWVQLTSELRNPFFGHEMLDCGVEVK